MVVTSAGPYVNHLLPSPNATTMDPHHSISTGQMLLLMPNQWCQSTEGLEYAEIINAIISVPIWLNLWL